MQAIELVRERRADSAADAIVAASAETLPIPMAMATGAVHQALVAAGLRTLAGLRLRRVIAGIFIMRRC